MSGRPGPTGRAAEYLEKLVADGFGRELDQEEGIARSLPFFATSIGVLVAFIGLAQPTLEPFSWAVWPVIVYGLLAGVVASLAALLVFLSLVVRHETFKYPMDEKALIDYAAELTAYYEAAADPGGQQDVIDVEAVEKAVVDDMRNAMTEQLAAAGAVSRANNAKRLRARSRAFAVLLLALVFAWGLVTAILIRDALIGGING
ncbi:MAG TPA: hypothetical protein VK943_12230 [Arenibaculum sp.]|nr:hypothetical protein [Arenibaculum sp.]